MEPRRAVTRTPGKQASKQTNNHLHNPISRIGIHLQNGSSFVILIHILLDVLGHQRQGHYCETQDGLLRLRSVWHGLLVLFDSVYDYVNVDVNGNMGLWGGREWMGGGRIVV